MSRHRSIAAQRASPSPGAETSGLSLSEAQHRLARPAVCDEALEEGLPLRLRASTSTSAPNRSCSSSGSLSSGRASEAIRRTTSGSR